MIQKKNLKESSGIFINEELYTKEGIKKIGNFYICNIYFITTSFDIIDHGFFLFDENESLKKSLNKEFFENNKKYKQVFNDILDNISNNVQHYYSNEMISNLSVEDNLVKFVYIDEIFSFQDITEMLIDYKNNHQVTLIRKPKNFKLKRIYNVKQKYPIGLNFRFKNIKKFQILDTNLSVDMYNIPTNYFVEKLRHQCKKRTNIINTEEFIHGEIFKKEVKNVEYNDEYELIEKQLDILNKNYMNNCSTYPYSIAMSVYKIFDAKKVLDMTAGWGDRLLSSLMCENVKFYLGVDPNSNLEPIYNEMIENFSEILGKNPDNFRVINSAFEDVDLTLGNQMIGNVDGNFDLMFTSPPFFNMEEYSEDSGQVFKRYETEDSWIQGFVKPSIQKVFRFLKVGGYMVLDIGEITYWTDVKNKIGQTTNYLPKWFDFATLIGFEYIGSLPYRHKISPSREIFLNLWIFKKVININIEHFYLRNLNTGTKQEMFDCLKNLDPKKYYNSEDEVNVRNLFKSCDNISSYYNENLRWKSHVIGYPSFEDAFYNNIIKSLSRKKKLPSINNVLDKLYKVSKLPNIFAPSRMITIIDMLKSETEETNKLKIFDPSSGWGDRLIASMAMETEYLGVDPNLKLVPHYENMISELSSDSSKYKIFPIGIEDFYKNLVLNKSGFNYENYFDFAFSSPPFFDYEIYEHEGKQSYLEVSNYEKWIDDWMYIYLKTCELVVKNNSFVVIYIDNTWKYKNIVEDILEMVNNKIPNLKFLKYIYMIGNRNKKYRVLVWKKKYKDVFLD